MKIKVIKEATKKQHKKASFSVSRKRIEKTEPFTLGDSGQKYDNNTFLTLFSRYLDNAIL